MNGHSLRYPAIAVALVLVLPLVAGAQVVIPRATQTTPRWIVGGDLALAEPRGDFAKYVDRGFGGGFTGLFRLDDNGVFFARGDFGTVRYGQDKETVFVFGNRAELTTTHSINWFGIGLQAMSPRGPVRPYVNATLATTGFTTGSKITDYNDPDFEYGRVDHMNDRAMAWIFGGGLRIPFGRNSPFGINVGARYSFGSEAEYLPEDGIQDNPDGSVTLSPVKSKTDLFVWQLGVSIALTPQLMSGN